MRPCTAFIDDSGQKEFGEATSPFLVYCSVLVHDEDVQGFEHKIEALKTAAFGTMQVEIKSYWLRNPKERKKRYLKPFGISEADLTAFVNEFYRWIASSRLILFASVIDKPKLQAEYAQPHYPSSVAYEFLLQRLQNVSSEKHLTCSVVMDKTSGKTPKGSEWQKLLEQQHRKLKQHGSSFIKMHFRSICGEVVFEDSKRRNLIQIADICAYDVFRQFTEYADYWDDPQGEQVPLYGYFARIVHKFHTRRGLLQGVGIVKFPPRRTTAKWRLPVKK